LHAQFLSWRCCRVVRPRSGWSRRAGMPAWAATFTLTWSRLLVSAVRHSPAPAWSSIGLGRPYARVPAAASGSSLVPIPEPGPPCVQANIATRGVSWRRCQGRAGPLGAPRADGLFLASDPAGALARRLAAGTPNGERRAGGRMAGG
jgi:hypothetical protein